MLYGTDENDIVGVCVCELVGVYVLQADLVILAETLREFIAVGEFTNDAPTLLEDVGLLDTRGDAL